MPGTPAAQCDYDVATVAVRSGTGTQAITLNCGGKTPKGGVIIATRATALGTTVAGAMISIAVWDAAGTVRLVSCMAEDGALVATANSGRRQSNASLVQELDPGSEAITGEALFSSVSADTLTINVTDAFVALVQLEVWAFYGDTLQAFVDQIVASPTINTQVAETGIPFMPRALISIGAAGGFATSATSARMAFGVCAFDDAGGVVGQCGMPFFDRNLPTLASATGGGFRTDSMLQRITVATDGTLTEDARYRVDDATADGFRVTTLAGSNGITIGYLALYTGSLRAWVGNPSIGTNATGNKAITSTGPGWRPRMLAALASRQGTNNTYVSDANSMHFCVGAAVSGSQASAGFFDQDNQTPTDTRSMVAATLASIEDMTAAVGTLDWSATLVSFDQGGFTVNVGTASAGDRQVGFLAFEAGSEKARGRRRITRSQPGRVTPHGGHILSKRNATVPGVPASAPVVPAPSVAPRRAHVAGVAAAQAGASAPFAPNIIRSVAQAPGAVRPGITLTRPQVPGFGLGWLRAVTRFRLERLMRLRWKPRPDEEPPEGPLRTPQSPKGRVSSPGAVRGRIRGG